MCWQHTVLNTYIENLASHLQAIIRTHHLNLDFRFWPFAALMSKNIQQSQIRHWVLSAVYAYDKIKSICFLAVSNYIILNCSRWWYLLLQDCQTRLDVAWGKGCLWERRGKTGLGSQPWREHLHCSQAQEGWHRSRLDRPPRSQWRKYFWVGRLITGRFLPLGTKRYGKSSQF